MLALFLAAFAAVIWLANLNVGATRQHELANSTVSVSESIRLRLKGNEDYLSMLAKNRADGSLDAKLFQQRAGNYVREHPEIINITWVDAGYFIRDVAPLASNGQIVGLHLDLPEPKRVSQLAKELRQPVYTRPFEAIQGRPSFEIWVPVFAGDNFLGLFAGVYSCDNLLRVLVPGHLHQTYHASLLDATGRMLAQSPKTGRVDEKLVHKALLTPGDSGVYLLFGSYGLGRLGWVLQLLEFLCLGLVLGMAYAIWVLNREVRARRQAEEKLYLKTVMLEEELAERQVAQEALEVQAILLEAEIEERARAEESLRESEARFRVLIEQAPDAIVVYDLDLQHFVDANVSAEKLFGCNRSELLKSGPQRFYTPQQPDERNVGESFDEHNEQALAGEPVQFERAIRTADGRDLICSVRLSKLPYEKRRLIRASFVDTTERKMLEDSLRRQAIQLEEELAERQAVQETLQEQATVLEEEIEERRQVEDALQVSEATIRNKLKAILEPEGDIGTLELSDIIDCDELQSMMDDFYKLTGMLGAVLDVSGKVLVAVGWQDICTKFHRCHPDTLGNCMESDTILSSGVPLGTFKRYHCKNNLWDMVTPVVVGGRHIGNVFIGQFFYEDEVPDVELFRAQARQYGFDETAYLAALDRVPRFSREAVNAGMQFYAKLARVISSLSFSSIQMSRMLADLRRSEEQIRLKDFSLSSITDAVYWVADDGRIWDVNDAALDMLGYTREEFCTMGIPDIDPNFPMENWRSHWEDLKRKGSIQLETLHRTKDGRVIPVEVNANYCCYQNLEYNCAITRNIADRKHLEEQLRQSQKMEAVGLLAGGVAHDFNNILMVIMGYSNMLKMDSRLDARQREKIDQILSSADKAAHLTQGLLAFSRKQILAPKTINLNDIAQNVNKFIARIIGEDIVLKTTTYGEGLTIYADTSQIEQVLINLATNARDAMPKGGLLTIETGLQLVEAPMDQEYGSTVSGRYAVLTVSDTGSGMDESTRKRIFEPFFTTKEVGKGTGLGMAIVYGIVKQHNGFIHVQSEPGQGSTFKIFLPIYRTPQSIQLEEAQAVKPQGGTETILLAEDDVDVRDLVVAVLTEFGYDVIQAVDGQDAVEKFQANRDSIDLVLMDMIMPKKNGKDAYEEVSRLQPDVKVIYFSGYTADFIQNRGVSEEGIELIMKPVQPTELLQKVRGALDAK